MLRPRLGCERLRVERRLDLFSERRRVFRVGLKRRYWRRQIAETAAWLVVMLFCWGVFAALAVEAASVPDPPCWVQVDA